MRGGARGSGRGRGYPAPLRNTAENVLVGTNVAKESSRASLSVLNDNTYDISTNIMIGINDTVPLGGISLPDPKPVPQHVPVSTENKIKNNDPYGLGLTEKELTYVTMENKLILLEVSTKYERTCYKSSNQINSYFMFMIVLRVSVIITTQFLILSLAILFLALSFISVFFVLSHLMSCQINTNKIKINNS
jgi:hypothetical protein